MAELIPINSLRLEELEARLVEMGEPKYKALQVFKWLSLGVETFDEMTDVSKALRAKLAEVFYIELGTLKRAVATPPRVIWIAAVSVPPVARCATDS